jgi:succinate dehydrogenase / fumarate reductase cytochrome b subunit
MRNNEHPNGPRSTRPLSPHLQIYKPQLTSMLSIGHRLTGIILSFGFVILVAWLMALASGPANYEMFADCAKSIPGQIVLIGLSLAFFYHLCMGIRHLLWDSGHFLDLPDVYKTGRLAVGTALALTVILWLKIYGVGL